MKRSSIPICLLCALVLLQIGTARLGAQTIQNPSFETPVVGSVANYNSYQFNPTGAVWTFIGDAGIAAKGSEFAPPPYTTDGNQIAFLEGVGGAGGTMSQTISNFPNGFFNYKFNFAASAFGSQTVTVLVDGTNVGSFTPSVGSWSSFQTIPITLYAGNHVISFTNQPSSQPTLVMLDSVGLMVTNAGLPVKVAAGLTHSLFVRSDGSLWVMGDNGQGQLGDGTYNATNRPEQIVASGVTAIAGGGYYDHPPESGHSLFAKSDGSLWAMGENDCGQLGDGTHNEANRPERIVVTNVTKVSAGSDHSVFLKSDGSLWGMGLNNSGQLGDGTYNTYVNSPEEIVASNVTAIAAGGGHNLFLKSDGSMWGMGENDAGQLGDSTYNDTNQPEQIVVASNVTVIAAGAAHSLFLKSDGSLWAMGLNNYGQLGDGARNDTNQPQQIVASNVTAIAAGYWHSLFLKGDGSLWAMGLNNFGQLGDGTYNNTNQPEQIVGSGVTAIAAGLYHSLFLKSDGSLWGMGIAAADGTYNRTNRPEQILAGPPGYNQMSVQFLSGGDVASSFLGIVGANYALDYASSLSPPNWLPLGTNSAGNGGMLWFTNTPDVTTNNFWRIRSVP